MKHPLVLTVFAAVLGAILIPQITNEWQDRQKEQDVKQSLLEEISTSSTTAVRQGVSLAEGKTRAAGGENGESAAETYAVLRNSWLIRRASARSRVIVYFPDLYACWYSYERAVADFISLSTPGGDNSGRVDSLQRYMDNDFAQSYVGPSTPDGCESLDELPDVVQTRFAQLKQAVKWDALKFQPDNKSFRSNYAILAEALLIGMERIVNSIEDAEAEGFSHGIL